MTAMLVQGVVLLFILIGGAACNSAPLAPPDASRPACADEYYQGNVEFPGGAAFESCSPAQSDGMVSAA